MFYEDENLENVEMTAFEEEMQKQLLIEALTQQKAEVFENVVFDGTRRYYIEDFITFVFGGRNEVRALYFVVHFDKNDIADNAYEKYGLPGG